MAATPDFSARSSFEAQLAGSPVCVIDESIAEEALLALLKGVRAAAPFPCRLLLRRSADMKEISCIAGSDSVGALGGDMAAGIGGFGRLVRRLPGRRGVCAHLDGGHEGRQACPAHVLDCARYDVFGNRA